MDIAVIIKDYKSKLQEETDKKELAFGEIIFNNGECQILSQSLTKFELIVTIQPSCETSEYMLEITDESEIVPKKENEYTEWDRYSYACLLQVENELHLLGPKEHVEHKKYTREGMKKRVLYERYQKAEKANYRVQWADNIYGDHSLINEQGVKYKVFLRDFENETGYSNSVDAKINKLGTTKHIMYAFRELKNNKRLYNKLDKTYPFIEIYCDPLNDYKITWSYPHGIPIDENLLISRYFGKSKYIEDEKIKPFLEFINEAESSAMIHIRQEVRETVEKAYEKSMLENLEANVKPDFNLLNVDLFDYQKEGIKFSLFRKASIIADEMGLGKTLEAIGAAVLKKEIFGFGKTLVICPASLKEQWKREIERFSNEKALVIQGTPAEREKQYMDDKHFFHIVNYEAVLRDNIVINKGGIDFLILDEAQRAKNYETKTNLSLKKLSTKHVLVITGTPIENRLIDIFSILSILAPDFLGPLWEFSYQHCLFDPERHNKINGYYNLQKLNSKLEQVLIRREKRKVLEQLPNLQQFDISVDLSPLQSDYHASFARGIAKIIHKKYLTPYDLQKLMVLLANMRMVCDSTYLIDEETNESPKLDELKYMLLEKLDVQNNNTKIIIFSEWIKVHKLIGKMLRDNNIGFVELNGKIPVKHRGELIKKFETNEHIKLFLSTEAGGTGLNLQVADTLINFELPWNPAKKNQRIGRIDRLGQKSNKLTIYNFITRKSIEQQIAVGLLVKQNLFDGVLDSSSTTDFVDFSTKGRSQFIQQLEKFIAETEKIAIEEEKVLLIEDESIEEPAQTEKEAEELDFSEEQAETESIVATEETAVDKEPGIKTEELEQVMNSGMQFLAGLFKMSTGKVMGIDGQKIEINKETGEVIMKFKLPV